MLVKLSPGRQPFNYYLCRNSIKTSDLVNPSIKINWQALVVLIFSAVIHVYIKIRIKYYKYSTTYSVPIISKGEFLKNLEIMDIEEKSISGLVTNVINVILIFASFLFSSTINSMDPDKANTDSFYLVIYFYDLLFPCMLLGTITITYYLRHPPLRKTIYREIICNFLSNIINIQE